jgi:hypothetical protein
MDKIKAELIILNEAQTLINTVTGCICQTIRRGSDIGELCMTSVFIPGEHYDEESGCFVRIKKEGKDGTI